MPLLDGKEIEIFFSEEDLPYEEEILRNPFSVKHWLRYIEHKKGAPKQQINLIYERALKELPGSFKLWYNYLKMRRSQTRGRCITDPCYEEVNNCFERSLVFMHKMPRIWMDYCTFLTDQFKITSTRRAFDSALRALPITQHHRIWPLYLNFLKKHNIPETAIRVFRRYLKLCPEDTEEYIDYLISIEKLDEAALKLAHIVNNENFQSKHGKSNHQLWNELCELISKNPASLCDQCVSRKEIENLKMKVFVAFAAVLVVALAQEYEHPYDIVYNNFDEIPESYIYPEEQGLRFRRDVTWDKKTENGRVFGTLGQSDDALFGRAGVERNIFNDARGRLDAQAHGTRTLGPAGGTSALGGSLNWKNDNAAASFDVSKQIHGPTSWSAAGGGRWPVGKNGDFGVDGTYSRVGGLKDYGARGVFNYRW